MLPRLSWLLLLLLLLWALAPAQVTLQSLPQPDAVYQPPFSAGERLVYQVNWKPVFLLPAFKAGEISLEIVESEFKDRDTYRIQAWAKSDGALTRVAGLEVRNYFESEVDRQDFRSYRNIQRTREGSRQRNLELLFDYEGDRTVVRETDPSVTPPREIRNKVQARIPAPAVDVLSAFYVTRLKQFSPGERFSIWLNERGEFRQVEVGVLRKEKVKASVGSFECHLVSTQGGLFKDGGDFRLWFTDDRLRVPVYFEADVRFGKVYGDLIRLETPQLHRGVIRVR